MTQPAPTSGDPTPTMNPPTPTPAPAGPIPPAPTAALAPSGQPADEPLGAGGKKALDAEREARKALEKQLAELAPLKKLAEAFGAGTPAASGKSEVELLQDRFGKYEQDLAAERVARWRAEVAAEKQLPPALAARLQGATREELAADADALKALIPASSPPAGPRTPAPDPTQGPRGPVDLDAQIREAEAKGNVRESIRLKSLKLQSN